jgi:hypothetical protein
MAIVIPTSTEVSDAVFYTLFRVIEIDEYAGPEKALEWARSVVEDRQLREAFADSISERLEAKVSD